jgi:hypothetical protein
MKTAFSKLKPAIKLLENTSSTLIHQNTANVRIDDTNYNGVAEVFLELLPRPNIFIIGCFDNVTEEHILNASMNFNSATDFSINGVKIEGFRAESGGDLTLHKCNIKWCPKLEPIIGIGDESTSIKYSLFHLFNFKNFHGAKISRTRKGQSSRHINFVTLKTEDLTINIKSLFETEDNIKTIKEKGLCCLTHIGSIEKTSGEYLTGKNSIEILNELASFFSFTRGGRCNPICTIGFDESNNHVWESWSSPVQVEAIPLSWFDAHHSSQLVTFFQGFHDKWKNKNWRSALREVIYWHLSANIASRGIDIGIIITQAALERLSYEFSVTDKSLISDKGFKDLWASDKLRLLFSSLRLPLGIPDTTPNLKKLTNTIKWVDAPQALTEIRNSLVHPEHKYRGRVDSALYETWNLGLWYLEMAILAICGYSGTYANRLAQRFTGDVEPVPWQ